MTHRSYEINIARRVKRIGCIHKWQHESKIVLPAGTNKEQALWLRMTYSAAMGDDRLLTIIETETAIRQF